MANTKISALPAATTVGTGDLLPVVQSGVTKQVTPDLLPVSTAAAAALAANATADRARANHTGTQTADTITDGTTNKAYTATEKTKLAGIATGATANRTDSATDTAISTAVANLVNAAPGTLDTLGELATQLQADESAATALTTLVGTKAPLASPTFTGTPTKAGTALATVTDVAGATLSLPVNVMSANGTAVIGARNAVNASAGPVAVTMPTPTAVGQHMIIERFDTSAVAANAVTITGTIRGTANTVVTLAAVGAANEGGHYVSESLTSWAIAGSIKPKAVLDALYVQLTNVDPTPVTAADITYDGTTTVAARIADLLTRVAALEAAILITNTVAPAITGTATVGQTLTVSTGTWTNSPTGYTYVWKRGGTAISGATAATYVLVSADAATSITCTVTATRSGFTSASATSNAVTVSGAAPTAPVTDDFTGTFSTTKWPNSSGTVANVSGRLRITPTNTYPQAATGDVFDLTQGYRVSVQIVTPPNQGNGSIETKLFLSNSNYSNTVFFDLQWPAGQSPYYFMGGSSLSAVSGSTTVATATAGTYVGFLASGGNLLFQTSPDGTTWTTRYTVTYPTWMNSISLRAALTTYFTGTEPTPGFTEFDNFCL